MLGEVMRMYNKLADLAYQASNYGLPSLFSWESGSVMNKIILLGDYSELYEVFTNKFSGKRRGVHLYPVKGGVMIHVESRGRDSDIIRGLDDLSRVLKISNLKSLVINEFNLNNEVVLGFRKLKTSVFNISAVASYDLGEGLVRTKLQFEFSEPEHVEFSLTAPLEVYPDSLTIMDLALIPVVHKYKNEIFEQNPLSPLLQYLPPNEYSVKGKGDKVIVSLDGRKRVIDASTVRIEKTTPDDMVLIHSFYEKLTRKFERPHENLGETYSLVIDDVVTPLVSVTPGEYGYIFLYDSLLRKIIFPRIAGSTVLVDEFEARVLTQPVQSANSNEFSTVDMLTHSINNPTSMLYFGYSLDYPPEIRPNMNSILFKFNQGGGWYFGVSFSLFTQEYFIVKMNRETSLKFSFILSL